MLSEEVKESIKELAKKEYPLEMCGVVVEKDGDQLFVKLENKHEDPESNFLIDPIDYLEYENFLLCIVHSHTDMDPSPSRHDMQQQIVHIHPWATVGTDGTSASEVVVWGWQVVRKDLVGRRFCHGVSDCYALIRDWYYKERVILLKEVPREWEWWKSDENLYYSAMESVGFNSFSTTYSSAEPGDLLYMRIGSRVANHSALYIGNGKILHHLQGQLSTEDCLYSWAKKIEKVVRYEGTSDTAWSALASSAKVIQL